MRDYGLCRQTGSGEHKRNDRLCELSAGRPGC
jgi:hypothetical protein